MTSKIGNIDLSGTWGCAAFNLRKTSRTVSQLYDAALAPAGLRSTQFAILVATAKTQPVSIGRLAAFTLSDQTTMTRNVAALAREGLLTVSARGAKGEKRVRLTKKGERALAKAVPAWRALQDRFVGAFGAQNWRDMRRGLEALSGLALEHSSSKP